MSLTLPYILLNELHLSFLRDHPQTPLPRCISRVWNAEFSALDLLAFRALTRQRITALFLCVVWISSCLELLLHYATLLDLIDRLDRRHRPSH